MFLMYSLASLPLIYVFAFIPKSELIGFIAFFIINTIGCFFDMVLDFIGVFSQAQATGATGPTSTTTALQNTDWILVIIFPSVNLKRSLFNIRLKSNPDCISALNSLFFTSYSTDEAWFSIESPGLGASFLIFWVQILFWWIILILIESGSLIRLKCNQCCKCKRNQISSMSPSWADTVNLFYLFIVFYMLNCFLFSLKIES